MRLLLPLLAALLLPGCFIARTQDNTPLERGLVATLEPGRSTAADAIALLGAPSQVVNLEGRSAYRYEFAQSKRAGLFLLIVGFYNNDTRTDRVWLFFDARDTLTHAAGTFEAEGAAYAMPWVDVHGDAPPPPADADETAAPAGR